MSPDIKTVAERESLCWLSLLKKAFSLWDYDDKNKSPNQ